MPEGGFRSEDGLDATGLRFAIVVARFNAHVTGKLYDGCYDVLKQRGAADTDIERVDVPGCFELPLVAKELGGSRRFDAIIALGAVIRGDTPHFEYVSSATALGLQQAALESGTPVVFGVLTTDNEAQAAARVAGEGHKGRESALTAIEIARTLKRIRQA